MTLPVVGDVDGDGSDFHHGLQHGSAFALLALPQGVLEARSPEGTPFGAGRALNVVRATRGWRAGAIVDALFQAVRDFTHPATPTDDVTAVVLKVEAHASSEPVATGCYSL
jgi:hypothetical protein